MVASMAGVIPLGDQDSEASSLRSSQSSTRERSGSSFAASVPDSGWPSKLCFASAMYASINSILLGYDIGVMGGVVPLQQTH